MKDWYHIFPSNTGLSLYIWIIFCVLPFYFIFRATSPVEIATGIVTTLIFFAVYWLTFKSKGAPVYIGMSIEIVINIIMTILFSYVYFALFIAMFIGNIKSRAGFITMYVLLLVTTVLSIVSASFFNYMIFLNHLPFLIMTILGVILIPLNKRSRLKQEALESQLEDANQRIAELAIKEERHRIARDLHDTLGQRLSMIGLKSDLSKKLIDARPEDAKRELQDIQDTARHALKEVREMISDMRRVNFCDELEHSRRILDTAAVKHTETIEADFKNIPILIENVLSMCLKESVTNIVKHSSATECMIILNESDKDIFLKISDNGTGTPGFNYGNGLQGMKERLQFVNGESEVHSSDSGFEVNITVPKVLRQIEEE
nr:sensor histidine kinase [Jeotgalicoccus saudimassiliensis]